MLKAYRDASIKKMGFEALRSLSFPFYYAPVCVFCYLLLFGLLTLFSWHTL